MVSQRRCLLIVVDTANVSNEFTVAICPVLARHFPGVVCDARVGYGASLLGCLWHCNGDGCKTLFVQAAVAMSVDPVWMGSGQGIWMLCMGSGRLGVGSGGLCARACTCVYPC